MKFFLQVMDLGRGQQRLTQQLDMVSGCLRDMLNEREQQNRSADMGLLESVFSLRTIYSKSTIGLGILSVGFLIGAIGAKAFHNR